MRRSNIPLCGHDGGLHEKNRPRGERSPRDDLIQRAKRGGITLVVGAGASISRGIPDWATLAKRLWADAFGTKPSPWEASDAAHSPTRVPQFLPIIFELAYRKMGEANFVDALQKNPYSKARHPRDDKSFKRSNDSLAVIARIILQEHKRLSGRRIDAIVTFNCDDLIEQAVGVVGGIGKAALYGKGIAYSKRITHVVCRGTHTPLREMPLGRQIPIYHIHGFVPSDRGRYYDHMLVFTDAQYWSLPLP